MLKSALNSTLHDLSEVYGSCKVSNNFWWLPNVLGMPRALLVLAPIMLLGVIGNVCTLFVLMRTRSTAMLDVRFYFLFVFSSDLLVQLVSVIKVAEWLPLSSELHLIVADIVCRVQRQVMNTYVRKIVLDYRHSISYAVRPENCV